MSTGLNSLLEVNETNLDMLIMSAELFISNSGPSAASAKSQMNEILQLARALKDKIAAGRRTYLSRDSLTRLLK